MSFDLGVFSAKAPLTQQVASAAYAQACSSGDSGLEPDERIAQFVDEITRRWPALEDVPDDRIDESPWASSFDASPAHAVIGISWSRADEVAPECLEIALLRGLYVYDPQHDELYAPVISAD